MGGKTYRFASLEHLRRAEALLEAAEAGIGPNPERRAVKVLEEMGKSRIEVDGASEQAVAKSLYTEGGKNVLIIRIDFSDFPGDPRSIYTASYVQDFADTQISPYFQQSSYGITSLTNTVTTQLYRMPKTGSYYATNGADYELHMAAETAAATNYNVTNYDRVMILFSRLSSIPGSRIRYAGRAEIGGRRVWINSYFDFRVVTHELGHTYGLWHANLWQVNDNDSISAGGSSTEYGDDFDTMGRNGSDDSRTDFNPWFKNRLNWLLDNQVITVATSGTYRIKRFDDPGASGVLALKVAKDAARNYWIGYRRSFTENSSLQNGAYIIWGYNSNQRSDLIDATTPGNSAQDAALAIGATLFDHAANITIRPIAQGGAAPNEYLDVQVTFGPVEPRIVKVTGNQTATPGQSIAFLVKADGIPVPTYQWQRQIGGTGAWSNLTDGESYSGAGTAVLILNDVTASMNGDQFRCVINNPSGSIISSPPAGLNVVPYGVTTLAGNVGVRSHSDGIGNLAAFAGPFGVAVDAARNVYVADTGNSVIRKITRAGVVSTLAGFALNEGYANGSGSNARFNNPHAVAVDGSGTVFVADSFNGVIRKITPEGVASHLAGLASSIGSTDGTGTNARFYNPSGIAVHGSGTVFVADSQNYTIRTITPAGAVNTLAGSAGASGYADGQGGNARFSDPRGIALDSTGNIYVADQGSHTIRKVTPAGLVSTLAGLAGISGSADGTGNNARFKFPGAVAVDAFDNVYVADFFNDTVRKITPNRVVSTLAGLAGSPGSNDGKTSEARFHYPMGIAIDSAGVIYVADQGNDTIRRIAFAPTPQLSGMARSNGVFRFVLNGPGGNIYVIEASSNLVNWLPLQTNTVPTIGSLLTVDSASGSFSRRFYRVRPWVAGPFNDLFANRTMLVGTNLVATDTNVGASMEPGEPFHWAATGGKSVWWTWQAPNSGPVTFSTGGSAFDTLLAIYTGNSVAALTLVANNDDFPGTGRSQITFSATAGTVYQIAVDGYNAESGSIVLSLVQ